MYEQEVEKQEQQKAILLGKRENCNNFLQHDDTFSAWTPAQMVACSQDIQGLFRQRAKTRKLSDVSIFFLL